MNITDTILADFRTWPIGKSAFSDPSQFPDDLLHEALCAADSETGGSGWGAYQPVCGNFKRNGLYYYAAAWLATFFPQGVDGDMAGEARLNTANKSVGDESISYRVAAMMDAGNDFLTFTVFGQQFYRLRRRAAMGARAV